MAFQNCNRASYIEFNRDYCRTKINERSNMSSSSHMVSDIFQYASCPYRWYLTRILNIDFDNIHTVRGTIAHTRTRNGELRKNSDVEWEQFDLNIGDVELYGVCDAVLFIRADKGISLPQLDGKQKYKVFPMEYKSQRLNGALWQPVHFQCVAQARCLSFMFHIDIESYYVYYHQEHLRKQYPISNGDFDELASIIANMDECLANRTIPPRTEDKVFCQGCSCREFCEDSTNIHNCNFQSYLLKEGV